ncbi:MAG: Txe/YoeB family addiction module toxin [Fretibacterium sp.]|jgi:toxin YoeB|nr:Txe/YoeB family addiction module toxin [Fretibacterium sp.]
MSDVNFTQDGWEDYLYWQVQDKKTLRKINSLLASAQRNPHEGEGKPEPLRGETGKWSRRINDKDRLVYSFENGRLTVYQCKGHYDDK